MTLIKAYILVFFSIICLSQVYSQELKYDRAYFQAFPDYHEVASNHFAAFPKEYQRTDYYLELEKHPDGWYLVKYTYGEVGTAMEREQIWDRKGQKYLFELPKNISPGANRIKGNYEFYIYPVYGYPEANQQTVDYLEEIPYEELTAEELEALARAYENIAYGDFRKQEQSALSVFDASFKSESIDPQVIATAEKNAWKSIEVFEYLAKKYPSHLSIVGDMKIKLANSYLLHHLMFQNIHHNKIAQKFLDKAKYSKETLIATKNILKSCPPNAILISYGDNDSYPLWYLQHKKGYRTDVTVLNQIQLALGRYIHFNTQLLPIGDRPKMTLDLEHYKMKRNNYCMVETKKSSLSRFLKDIQQNRTYPEDDLYISFPKTTYLRCGKDSIIIRLKGDYIYKNELAMLDLISSNWPQRPFCMVPQKASTLYSALRPYLQTNGVVQILQAQNLLNSPSANLIGVERSQALLLKKFKWQKSTLKEAFLQKLLPSAANMQRLYYQLILQQMEEKNLKMARKLFRSYQRRKIFKQMNSGLIHLYFAQIADDLGLPKNRNTHLKAYMLELEAALQKAKTPSKTAYERCYPAQNKASIQLKITEAIDFCQLQNWNDWAKIYQKQFKL